MTRQLSGELTDHIGNSRGKHAHPCSWVPTNSCLAIAGQGLRDTDSHRQAH
jgi:hypothetical protein